MQSNPQSAAIVPLAQRSVHALHVEALEHPISTPISSKDDSRTEPEADHSARIDTIDTYDSTPGVCNDLARIAMNRAAVMRTYDSMFPRDLSRRSRPGWVRRALDILTGRASR
jgi:hypothetical protein